MSILETIRRIVFFIPVFIYNLAISRLLTVYAHEYMVKALRVAGKMPKAQRAQDTTRILDIGIGTGMPLHRVYKDFGAEARILGVDIDEHYVKGAQRLFANAGVRNVEIRHQDFYTLDAAKEGRFDIVFFSFSFMLMPDPRRALQLAKSLVKADGGKILFLLTLNKKRVPIAEKIKPLIKHLTTIDFGNVVYENQFFDLIKEDPSLRVTLSDRVTHRLNPLLYAFRVFFVCVEVDRQ